MITLLIFFNVGPFATPIPTPVPLPTPTPSNCHVEYFECKQTQYRFGTKEEGVYVPFQVPRMCQRKVCK